MLEVTANNLRGAANICAQNGRRPLTAMFAADETWLGKGYAIYCLFEDDREQTLHTLRAELAPEGDLSYPALTSVLPAAAWYEREIHDLLGLLPVGHPDLRPLVLHETFPEGFYPLRKNIPVQTAVRGRRDYKMHSAQGEGVFEVAVGPIHAGIIEPGHFRFSQAGEAMLQLDAKLFFTHRGIEKALEGKTVDEGLVLVERICGACTVANSLSYCQAVEKLANQPVPRRAWLIRTVLAEMERLVNHVGDTGNMCAGVGFAPPVSMGARLKEVLMQANEQLTGNRFLRGMIMPGGVKADLGPQLRQELSATLDEVAAQYKTLVQILAEQTDFLNRIRKTGVVRKQTALDLALVGVGARASGVAKDCRKDLPYGLYEELSFATVTEPNGDVEARLLVREREVTESIKILRQVLALLEEDTTPLAVTSLAYRTQEGSWGMSESAHGSNLHWLMLDAEQKLARIFVRSASYPNWPAVPMAVQGDIIPDFPLINKSFELCYACLDR
ncbi:MAG: NADH-quinone oxidoreductase subunit C [Acidaminococcaceae bacterium]